MPTANPVPNESIADRVARRRREAAHSVLDHDTGQLLEYRQLLKNPKFKEIWTRSAADEFGRLAQGIGGRIKSIHTIHFIHKREIPADRLKDVTYIVCLQRPNREEGSKSNQSHNGREPHQLSGRCWYPDSQPVAHQNIFEQRHINARSQVCRRRSHQFLPHDSIEKARVRTD